MYSLLKWRAVPGIVACATVILTTPVERVVAADMPQAALDELETIVVTARRREESLTRVPASITALSEGTLRDAGIDEVADYAALVPNVSFQAPLNFNDVRISVRGVSQIQGGQPPVAMVVDGVQLLSPTQFNVEQFDLERIEFLKGPQGAVYGRNAIMGAINVVTKVPAAETEGYLRLRGGSGEDYGLAGAISGPIVADKLAYRLAGSWRDRRGELQNQTNGQYRDAYDDSSIRGRLLYTPTADWSFDLKAGYSNTDGGDVSYQGIFVDGRPNDNEGPLITDTLAFNTREIFDTSLAVNWTAAGTWSMNAAYFDSTEDLLGDFDAMPLQILTAFQLYDEHGASQELRYASPADRRVRWIVGVYHVETKKRTTTTLGVDSGFLFSGGEGPLSGEMLADTSIDTVDFENFAQFGQLEIDLTDRVELALALRNDDDQTEVLSNSGDQREFSVQKLQPKLTLTYRPTQHASLYASYGEGFRSGGLNPTTSPPGFERFRAEEAQTFELGFKTSFLDNRGYFSAALFHTDLDNAQQLILDASSGANFGVNVDEARLRGGEVELGWKVLKSLTLSAALGVTRSDIEAFAANPEFIGNDLPRVPEHTFALSATYERDISSLWRLFARADVTGEGEMAWHVDNADRRESLERVDLRLGVRSTDDAWDATAWVKNVADNRTTQDFQAREFTGFAFDVYTPTLGRTWGLELTRRF
jgi:iron complex outermembrane recepter protein